MTHYAPCIGCARKMGCTILADVRKAVAGNGRAISVVKVNCQKLYQHDFEPGTRVQVRTDRYTMSGKAYTHLAAETATILRWKKNGRALILLDDEEPYFRDYDNGCDPAPMCRLQSVEHRDLDLLPEPKREICGCGALIGLDGAPVTWTMLNNIAGGCQFGSACERGQAIDHVDELADKGLPF